MTQEPSFLSKDTGFGQVLEQMYSSTKVFAKTVFPSRFALPFSKMHDEIFSALDDPTKQMVVIAAPRGFGKSSIVNLAYAARNALFNEKNFIVMVSCSADQAVMQTENLKEAIVREETVVKLFGEVKSDSFSKEMWVTTTGTCVLPRGRGQQIRGLNFRGTRPDLIILDDIEDRDEVKNARLRLDTSKWFFSDVFFAVNKSKPGWKIVVVGTILSEDCLVAQLLKDPEWCHVRLELCDDDFNSNWEEYMTTEDIRKIADSFRERKMLSLFYMEYRNKVIADEQDKFSPNDFQYYEEGSLDESKLETIIFVDVARTTEETSCKTAIVAVGINYAEEKIYVREIINDRIHPTDTYDHIFRLCAKYRARTIAVEVTSLDEFITYPIKTEMIRRGIYGIELVELKARGNKLDRISALLPFYRKKCMFHNRICANEIEGQLLDFPNGTYVDVIDAVAYFVELLDKGDRYFYKTIPVETKEDIEKEYDKLYTAEDRKRMKVRLAV